MSVMQQNRKNNILLGQNNNALTWLIIINAVVFAGIYFIKVIYLLSYDKAANPELLFQTHILDWLTLPSSFDKLGSRPWTLITYMFTHDGVFPLIGTALWLWGFGYILQDLAGNNKLIPIYLYGGVAGGLFFLLAVHVFPGLRAEITTMQPFIGGGASIMAVAVATTTVSPGYRIFPMLNGGIPLWVLTLVFVIVDYATIASTNGAYAVGHLGGGLIGFIFIHQLRRGHDWSGWMISFTNWVDNLFNPEKKYAEDGEKQKLFYKAVKKPFVKKAVITQQKIDEVLDKINQKGYHLLTDEEKEFLKKASEQDL